MTVNTSDGDRGGARPSKRLSRQERRAHLLDTAAAMAAERGFGAVTMEGVAARAGVSKALPYQHFENSDRLIVALFDREEQILEQRIQQAAATTSSFDEALRVVVHTFFAALDEHPLLLRLVLQPDVAPRSHDGVREQRRRDLITAFSTAIGEAYGLAEPVSRVASSVLMFAMTGGYLSRKRGDAPTSEVEDITTELLLCALRSYSTRDDECAVTYAGD